MKVLIVDDVFIIRKHIENTLKTYNVKEISEAGDGFEALEIAEQLRPDVVILDLNMPVMGGMEIIPHLKKMNPQSLVVTMSSIDNQSTLVESLKLGADHYITKPLSYQQISEVLEFSTFKV